jgi:hypothetical protein
MATSMPSSRRRRTASGASGPQLVPHRDRAEQDVSALQQDDRGALLLEPLDVTREGARIDPTGLAQAQRFAALGAGEAVPGNGGDVVGRLHGDRPGGVGGGVEDRPREGVLAAGLQRGGGGQDVGAVVAGRGHDIDDLGPVAGQRAGLVQRDRPDPAQLLQRGTALDKGAVAAGRADRGDHGDRYRQRQRTR